MAWTRLICSGTAPALRGGAAFALLAVLGARVAAQVPSLPPASGVERYLLPNGLEVLLQPDRTSARVALVIDYHAGSACDPDGLAGLAHIAEHMAYRGSRHLTDEQFWVLQERWEASRATASTSPDETVYQTSVPAEQLARALWLESERMAFVLAAMTAQHLELERNIIRNEYVAIQGPSYKLGDLLVAISHPDGHPQRAVDSAAAESDLDDIELSDVQWFYQRVYRPDNASLVLVGDFDPAEAKTLIERYFAPIRNPRVPRITTRIQPVDFKGIERVRFRAPSSTEGLHVIWTLPAGALDARRAGLIAAASLLGKRLREELAHRARLSAAVQLSLFRGSAGDRVGLTVTTVTAGKLPLIERVLAAQLALLHNQPISDQSLLGLRQQLSWELLSAQESALDRALYLVRARPFGTVGAPLDLAAMAAGFRGLTAPELLATARALLPATRMLIVEVLARPRAPYGGELLTVEGALFGKPGAVP